MEQVLGIGGIFFKACDPKALAAWYREHLGMPVEPGPTYGAFTSAAAGEQAVWSAFPADTSYFGSGPAPFMVNYRVRNLDAMLAQLRAAGAPEGTERISRLYPPLGGMEQTARALRFLLEEQMKDDKSKKK
jgi:hypothetical protein